jgi:hypothetical protein
MPITPRSITDAATAATKWSTRVAAAGNDWADGWAHPTRSPFDPNTINADGWQAGVTAPGVKERYQARLAGTNQEMALASVNGAGKGKYQASGTNRKANVQAALSQILPIVGQVVQNLNQTMPKGPRGTNGSRGLAFSTAMHTYRGTFGR